MIFLNNIMAKNFLAWTEYGDKWLLSALNAAYDGQPGFILNRRGTKDAEATQRARLIV